MSTFQWLLLVALLSYIANRVNAIVDLLKKREAPSAPPKN
jgi:hypothetical protein